MHFLRNLQMSQRAEHSPEERHERDEQGFAGRRGEERVGGDQVVHNST